MRATVSPGPGVSSLLERWVCEGTITPDQAEHMRADLVAATAPSIPPPEASRNTSLVTEALGYLGGIIILVASGLVTGWFWAEMSNGVRLAVAGGVALLLVVAGAAVSRRLGAAGVRLRSVLWLLASAALAAFLGLAASVGPGWDGEQLALFAASGTAAASAALWYSHRHVLQHAATFVPLVVVAGTAAVLAQPQAQPGVAMWGLGVAWGLLAWGGVLPGRRPGMIFGAVAAAFAAMIVLDESWGTVLALLTVAALVLLAVAFRDLLLLAVGSVGALFVLPATMARLFPGMLAAAVALLAVGVVLVAAAIVTARRRRDEPAASPGRGDWSRGTPQAAVVAATAVAAATTLVILVAG